jgi:hypothetical protein
LAEKRRRPSRMNRNADPENPTKRRLQLFCETLRGLHNGIIVQFDPVQLASRVQFLKIPYMTREACRADLARVVGVLINLRYVDLPEGVYMGEESCVGLRQELIHRCRDIRKMTYMSGAEGSFNLLAKGGVWPNLEVLELSGLNMDPVVIRHVLGSLPYLRALKVSDMRAFNDDLFRHNDGFVAFPPLQELIFENTPNLTAAGLSEYLTGPETRNVLETLSLTLTGVLPSALHQILSKATRLTFLSIIESVSTPFPGTPPPLSSSSLETLHYEISSASTASSYASMTTSYYGYLTSSLIYNSLPALRQLYVRGKLYIFSNYKRCILTYPQIQVLRTRSLTSLHQLPHSCLTQTISHPDPLHFLSPLQPIAFHQTTPSQAQP